VYLLRYGTSIGRFLRSPDMNGLADALARQRSFWRFVGIMTATVIGLYFVAIFVGIVAAVFVAARSKG
jgi:high-affinity nickel permease